MSVVYVCVCVCGGGGGVIAGRQGRVCDDWNRKKHLSVIVKLSVLLSRCVMYVSVCLYWFSGGERPEGRGLGGGGGGEECRDGVKPQALVYDKSDNARSVRG